MMGRLLIDLFLSNVLNDETLINCLFKMVRLSTAVLQGKVLCRRTFTNWSKFECIACLSCF